MRESLQDQAGASGETDLAFVARDKRGQLTQPLGFAVQEDPNDKRGGRQASDHEEMKKHPKDGPEREEVQTSDRVSDLDMNVNTSKDAIGASSDLRRTNNQQSLAPVFSIVTTS